MAPLHDLVDCVGATPLVELHLPGAEHLRVVAKLESFNPGGSAKDRSAVALVDDALASGRLRPGGRIVESSSGNAAVALATIAIARGVSFTAVVDERANESTVSMIRALGADVERVTEPDPETGDWLAARIKRVRELCDADPDAVWLNQYANPAVFAAHRDGTMAEIVDDLGAAPDWLFVAVSTTGTIGGCLEYVQQHQASTRVVAVDAPGSVLFGGCHGERHLPGYGAGVEPPLSKGLTPYAVDRVDDVDAVAGARALARRSGILAGASGGAVFAAFRARQASLTDGETAALILHDGGVPYAATVYSDDWVAETFGIEPDELEEKVQQA